MTTAKTLLALAVLTLVIATLTNLRFVRQQATYETARLHRDAYAARQESWSHQARIAEHTAPHRLHDQLGLAIPDTTRTQPSATLKGDAAEHHMDAERLPNDDAAQASFDAAM